MSNPSRASQFGAASPARQGEQRAHIRRKMAKPVSVSMGPMESGILLDISAQGAGIQVTRPLKPGLRLGIAFQLPASDITVQPTYEVVWASDGRVGLRFLYTTEPEHHQLREWLATQPLDSSDLTSSNQASAETFGVGAPTTRSETEPMSGPAQMPVAPHVQSYSSVQDISEAADDALATLLVEAAALSPETVLAHAVHQAQAVTLANGAAIALRVEHAIICKASVGDAPDVGVELNSDSGLSGECLRTGNVVRCDDAMHDSRVDPAVARLLNLRSAMVVPIQVAHHVLGLVEIFAERPSAFTVAHLSSLERIAREIASAMVTQVPHDEPALPGSAELSHVQDSNDSTAAPEPNSSADSAMIASIVALLEPELQSSPSEYSEPEPAHIKPHVASMPLDMPSARGIGSHSAPSMATPPLDVIENVPSFNFETPGRLGRGVAAALFIAVLGVAVWAAHFFFADASPTKTTSPSGAATEQTPNNPPVTHLGKKSSKNSQPATSAEPLRLPAAFMERRVISGPSVEVPQFASGRVPSPVVLEVLVGSDGKVANASYVSGDQMLARAAIETIRRWKYQPYVMNGKAIPIVTVVTINFKPAAP